MTRYLKLRLSVMMFLQYFVHGATVPIFSLYLTRYLHFTGLQAGAILSMSAVAAFVSPLAGAFIADRLLSTPRLYGTCHILGALLMGLLSDQTRYGPFLILYLIYMLVFGPTHSLSNAIAFHHLPDSERSFGRVRMWGTIGWIAVAWIFSFLWLRSGGEVLTGRLPDALKLSALSSMLLGLYAWTLPKADLPSKDRKQLLPVEACRVMVQRNVVLLSAISFLISFIDRFYYFGSAPFLRQIGFSEADIMPAMSLGQIPEVFAMALLGFFLARLGHKHVLCVGIVMELGRFAAFTLGAPTALVLTGLSFHGIAYTFFFTTAFIFLDRHCDRASRSGAHQLFAIITSGFGSFLGSIAAGKSMDFFTSAASDTVNYQGYWAVPTVLSAAALAMILMLFRNTEPKPS